MPAFSYQTLSQLQTNVRNLFYRRQRIGRLTLSADEFYDTFVPTQVRDTFRQIAPYLSNDRHTYRWTLDVPSDGSTLNAYIHMIDKPNAPPVPRDLHIQPDAPKEVVERIHYWAVNGGDTSREFGRVTKVLSMLNEHCSRNTMRYYWPTILALCSESNHTKHLVDELHVLRAPSHPKPLPLGLIAACRRTAETIATAKLVPTDVDEEEKDDISIDIVTGQTYNEGFGTFYGLG